MVRLPENRGEDSDKQPENAPGLAALSQEVKELVRLISSTDISELHLESGAVRITIKRASAAPAAATNSYSQPAYIPAAALTEAPTSGAANLIGVSPTHGGEIALNEGEQFIVAPMVGTFYAAQSPDTAPYVSEGDVVEPGQTVGIIEAMKMMNEIEAELAGRVTRILVPNAQPVEYGQPLMVIEVM